MIMTDTGYYDQSYPPSLWNGPDPSIANLNPTTGSAAAGPILVTVTGANFSADSVVEINQVAQTTTFVSPTSLTVSFDPSVAGTVTFTVRRGTEESNSVPFVVTATEEEPEPEEDEPPVQFTAIPVDSPEDSTES